MQMVKNKIVGNKKIINAWAFYDWANSAYPLVITTAVFPIYYSNITANDNENLLYFFGFYFTNTALYSYILSFSFLLVAAISPILSGIADYSGKKLFFMKIFCYIGAFSSCLLYFFDADRLGLSFIPVIGASVGFWGSLVFYNAFLPEIAERKEHDYVSAKGYSLGYLGSSLLLITCLIFIMMPSLLFDVSAKANELMALDSSLHLDDAMESASGFYTGLITRFSFVAVGIWWFGFAQLTFKYLPNNIYNRKPSGNIFWKGYQEIKKVWFELNETPRLKIYLLSFFIYSMGVQTVILMATLFGEAEVHMGTAELITTVLIIQFVAIGGSYLFSFLSAKLGNMKALGIALIIWIMVCVSAYFVYNAVEFYALAFVVGLIMGGIQSLSRSTYSKLLPETVDHASYFSFYDVCEKLGIVIGTLAYGSIIDLTGSMRNSIIALCAFFILGFIVLLFVPKTKYIEPIE
jgi:UMF1 family MFS transporter